MLNREQVTAEICEWMERVQGADAKLHALAAMVGDLDYETPLPKAIDALIESYSDAVSRLVGDEADWLEYFWTNCEFGANPLGVIPEPGAAEIKIDGPEALAEVICWDRDHGEAAR